MVRLIILKIETRRSTSLSVLFFSLSLNHCANWHVFEFAVAIGIGKEGFGYAVIFYYHFGTLYHVVFLVDNFRAHFASRRWRRRGRR